MLLSALRRGAIRATAVISGGAALSEEYPVFTREEIAKRDGKRGATWVTYKDRVYDISEFVNAHGGPCLIMILTVSCGVVVLPVGKEKCRRDSQRETAQHQFFLNGSHRI